MSDENDRPGKNAADIEGLAKRFQDLWQAVFRFEFGRAENTKRTLMTAYSPKSVIVPKR